MQVRMQGRFLCLQSPGQKAESRFHLMSPSPATDPHPWVQTRGVLHPAWSRIPKG